MFVVLVYILYFKFILLESKVELMNYRYFELWSQNILHFTPKFIFDSLNLSGQFRLAV